MLSDFRKLLVSLVSSDFKKLLVSRVFFSFSTEVMAVLLGWRMYALTQDPLFLGLVGLAEALPALSLALFAGFWVDRSRPMVVFRGVLAGNLLSFSIVFLSQLPVLGFSGPEQVAALFLASFLGGVARSFSQPSVYAIMPRLLSRQEIAQGAALSTVGFQLARIFGPAAGGILFGWLGATATASVAMGILLLGLFALNSIRVQLKAPEPTSKLSELKLRQVKEEFFSGAKFVLKHPILFPALSLDMISVFFAGVTALLPIFASDILAIGPKGLGLLRAAPAIGAAIVSFGLLRWNVRARAGEILLFCVGGFSLSIFLFGLSTNVYLSALALFLSGGFDSVSMVIRSSAIQLASPEAMRGKISAVNAMFIGSSNELGEFESGVAAKLLGTVPAVLLGGIVSFVTVLVVYSFCPALRKLHLDHLTPEAG